MHQGKPMCVTPWRSFSCGVDPLSGTVCSCRLASLSEGTGEGCECFAQQLAQKRDPTVHHKEIFGRASDSAAVPTPSSVAEWWMRHKSLIYNALRAISPRNSLPRKVPSSSVLVSARALLLPDIPSPLPGPLQPAPLTRFPTRRVRLAPRGGVVIIPRALRRRRRRSRGTRASGAPALSAGFISEERQDAMDRTTLRVALLEMLEHNCGEPVEHFDEDMSLRADLGL